ncbi:CS1 type fimbrial major subunit [Pseudomonas sp. BJa5]|uniref:CS1 type fimbrial major subunit n=1 Tax=Pseudomonas sp. BJa5 TaxID=2936270 RepID=UPI00255A051F|nr:CS1 type fimbrial major subunit [Pseudomonas sp. BGr12]MDL2419996.1 fimbrial protein [Pseudomonas sp. BGr12]
MKKIFLALPLALLTSTSAFALDPIEKQVQVTAQIPTESFYVEPVGGNWMNDPQQLGWDAVREQLQPVRKQLQVKSTTGPISAYLLSPAVISSGGNNIGLNVKVADTVLSTSATEVVNAADAAPGTVVGFEIAAQPAGAGGYVPGNYQGLVSMIFETPAP